MEPQTDERHHERMTHDARRSAILNAVRETCASDGINKVSISAVTKRAGCTRSLFYHYFPDRDAAIQAALDDSIERFIDRLREWNASREHGNIEGALDSIASLLKAMFNADSDMSRAMANRSEATFYADFVHRIADRTARYICDSTVVEFAQYHEVQIDHVYETFYVLITGLIIYLRVHPDAPVDLIKEIIASTLHIEGYTENYSHRRPER